MTLCGKECEKIDPQLDSSFKDVKINNLGDRLAIGSLSGHLCVMGYDSRANTWKKIHSIAAHPESINLVEWASSEFGIILATLSSYGNINIWEESDDDELGRKYVLRQCLFLPESRCTSMKFVRSANFTGLICLSKSGTMHLYSPSYGTSEFMLELVNSFNVLQEREPVSEYFFSTSSYKGAYPLFIAFFCPSFKDVKLIRQIDQTWSIFDELKGHNGIVLSVSWTYSINTSQYLIATACADGHIRIFKLLPVNEDSHNEQTITNDKNATFLYNKYRPILVQDLDSHSIPVHQVEWNSMGTVLTSFDVSGRILEWRSTMLGKWYCSSSNTLSTLPKT